MWHGGTTVPTSKAPCAFAMRAAMPPPPPPLPIPGSHNTASGLHARTQRHQPPVDSRTTASRSHARTHRLESLSLQPHVQDLHVLHQRQQRLVHLRHADPQAGDLGVCEQRCLVLNDCVGK